MEKKSFKLFETIVWRDKIVVSLYLMLFQEILQKEVGWWDACKHICERMKTNFPPVVTTDIKPPADNYHTHSPQ